MTKPKSANIKVSGLPNIKAAGAWPKTEVLICNSTTTGRYTAPELRPFAGRPGSLNFLRWPSRCGGQLTYREDAL